MIFDIYFYYFELSGATSPFVDTIVSTQGVVTLLTSNGFYMQDSKGDGNMATSDGIFVFTSTAPTVAIGDSVSLSGTGIYFSYL
jgi:predicted extracellular nuclease